MPCTILGHVDGDEHRAVVFERNRAQDACQQMGERIEELEIAIRASLSFVQERHTDHSDGHAQMVIAALRGALAKRDRD